MKKIIKGVFIPIIISMLFGFLAGRYVYNTYLNNIHNNLSSSRLYLIENGTYENFETMREENIGNNYIYYLDDDKYKTVVGITNNYSSIAKIKSLYNDELAISEYYINKTLLDEKQPEYEQMLSNANDTEKVKEAVDNILNLYRKKDSIRLISVN